MTLVIHSRSPLDPGANEVEVVERKGRGHPDTICDALSEEVSRALCRYYLEQFGRILHRNVDKVFCSSAAPAHPALAAADHSADRNLRRRSRDSRMVWKRDSRG